MRKLYDNKQQDDTVDWTITMEDYVMRSFWERRYSSLCADFYINLGSSAEDRNERFH